MKRLTINGVDYACPFAEVVRRHTTVELANLRADIKRMGEVACRVVTYHSQLYGWSIIDGMTRATIAAELGLDVRTDPKDYSDAEAHDRAIQLNLARRHLSIQEQEALNAERNGRIVAAATSGAGLSLREIGKAEGLSHTQVKRIVDAAKEEQAAGTTPEAEEAPKKRRKKSSPTLRARKAATTLSSALEHLLKRKEARERLRHQAQSYGVPLSDDGTRWPTLEAVCAVIRDFTPATVA